jgi:hypothetical protein
MDLLKLRLDTIDFFLLKSYLLKVGYSIIVFRKSEALNNCVYIYIYIYIYIKGKKIKAERVVK